MTTWLPMHALANAIALLHAAVIILEFYGAAAVLRGRFATLRLQLWQIAYLAVVFMKSVSYLALGECPLSIMESRLRNPRPSESVTTTSFVENYVDFLPSWLDQTLFFFLIFIGLIGILQFSIIYFPNALETLRVTSTSHKQKRTSDVRDLGTHP